MVQYAIEYRDEIQAKMETLEGTPERIRGEWKMSSFTYNRVMGPGFYGEVQSMCLVLNEIKRLEGLGEDATKHIDLYVTHYAYAFYIELLEKF